MNHQRPGSPEISKKVYEAHEAVAHGQRWIAVRQHYSENCAELFIDDEEQFWELILLSLNEIKESGPHKCYAGKQPPERAGEAGIKGLELWPFCWTSKKWTAKLRGEDAHLTWDGLMYLKFVIQKSKQAKEPKYGHVDIHKSRL